MEPTVPKDEPKALACYGLLARWWPTATTPQEELCLHFVDGHPVSGLTTAFLTVCCARLAAAGKTALLLVWDNASWHLSRAVRTWIADHNRAVTRGEAAVRLVVCPLPSKSPWLNPIEATWVHGKRRVAEPARLVTSAELEARVYAALGVAPAPHLVMPEKVA